MESLISNVLSLTLCRAFCNPADVEAFTEEKKVSLMNKRHGKGADFLRAVREIIDCYDELKKQEQANDTNNIIAHTASTNGVKSEECVASPGSKDEAVTPIIDSCSKIPDSLEPNDEVAALHVQDDKITTDWHNGNLAVKKEPLPTTYSRKKYSGTQVVSSRRSRSSVREDVLNNGNSLCLSRDGSQKRTKRVRTSLASSDEPGSNASPEENGSEVVTVDADTNNLNEGNCLQSGYNKVMENEYEMQLSQTLEFQNKAVINKKKRKPSKKREFRDKHDEVDKAEAVQNSDIEKSIGKYSKEDGDEHLPLVKRARVRMGRITQSVNKQSRHCVVSIDEEDTVPEGLDPCYTLQACSVNKPPLREANNNKNLGCFVDDEAALPPSKRLHRALEAMSAYVAEDKQGSPGGPSTMKTIINENLEKKETDDSSSNLSSPVEQIETIDGINTCSQPSRTSSPELKQVEIVDVKDSVMLDSSTEAAEPVACPESPKSSSDNCQIKESSPELKKDSSDVSGPGVSSDPVSSNLENGVVSHDDGKDSVMLDSFTETVETVACPESPKPLSDDVEKKESSNELKKEPSDISVSGVNSDPVSNILENAVVSCNENILENEVVSCNDVKDSVILDSFTEAVETEACTERPKPSSDDVENKVSSPEFRKDPSDVSGSGVCSVPVSSNLENGVVSHDDDTLGRSSPQRSGNIVDHSLQNDANENAL